MPGPTQNQWTWQERLIAELKHDKKKAVLLGVLAIVAGVLILQQLAGASPAESRASVTPVGPTASGPDASSTELSASGARARALTDAARRRNEYLQTMDRRIERDLFIPNSRYFAPRQEVDAKEPVGKTPEMIEQERRSAIRMQAKALTLQSTIVGSVPTAVINGLVLRKGDWVGGFEVTGVQPRSCTVRKDDVSVILKME